MSQVHQTTISAIENGKHSSPGIGTIERLSQALKISPLYFFEERILTPFDLLEKVPKELTDFLLREESLPYLMLSKKAYERGISSETLKKLLSIIQETIDEKEMV